MQFARLLATSAILIAASLGLSPVVQAQQAAPVPAPILTARPVFLANGAETFKKAGETNEPYKSVYDALQTWGHWQLVSSPDAADLILTVRFTAPVASYGGGTPLSYAPQLDLSLTDIKTHTQLWVLTEPFKGAFRKATRDKNYTDGITDLISQLKTLTTTTATP
jgi:hypothetical protein